MDNFFEILIYLVIIISFLSGLLKKKDKQKQAPVQKPQTTEYSEPEVTVVQAPQREEYDILREIEDFFKVGDQESKPQQTQTVPEYQPKRDYEFEEHKQTEQWHQPTISEHQYTDILKKKQQEVTDKTSKENSTIEQQAVKFQKHLTQKQTAASEISIKIKERLKHPATLKDYVIISEIMSKPKAFRI